MTVRQTSPALSEGEIHIVEEVDLDANAVFRPTLQAILWFFLFLLSVFRASSFKRILFVFLCLSLFFLVFRHRFFSFLFAFLSFSQRDKCKRLQFTAKIGISLRPHLHRPRAKFPIHHNVNMFPLLMRKVSWLRIPRCPATQRTLPY